MKNLYIVTHEDEDNGNDWTPVVAESVAEAIELASEEIADIMGISLEEARRSTNPQAFILDDLYDYTIQVIKKKNNMKTLSDFMKTIKVKDVEGNRTYLYTNFEDCKYGQSYQNTVNTIEDMKNQFAVFYYGLYQNDYKLKTK